MNFGQRTLLLWLEILWCSGQQQLSGGKGVNVMCEEMLLLVQNQRLEFF